MLAPCVCVAGLGDVLGTLRPKPLKARKCMAIRVAIVCAGQSLVEGVGRDRGGQAAWTSWLPKPGKLLDSNPRDCDCYCDCHCDCDCDCGCATSVCAVHLAAFCGSYKWPFAVFVVASNFFKSRLHCYAALLLLHKNCNSPHARARLSLSLFLSLSVGVLLTLLHATVANGAQLGAAINVAQCLTCYTVAVAGFLLHYVPSIYMRIF